MSRPETTFYGRLQFGYEKRSGGVSLLGSTGGLAADADQIRDRHRQLREHAAAHVQPVAVRRVHRRRELGAPVHQPVRPGGEDANDRRLVLPGMPQFFPQANPLTIYSAGDASPAAFPEPALVRHRAAVPVLRLQHAVQRLGQHDEDQGRAHLQGRASSSSTRRGRRADVELQRHLSFNTDASEPAEYERRVRERAARRDHPVPGVRRSSRRRTASS